MMKKLREWFCRRWGHYFHDLDMQIFKTELRAGIPDAKIRCNRCGLNLTLTDLQTHTRYLLGMPNTGIVVAKPFLVDADIAPIA